MSNKKSNDEVVREALFGPTIKETVGRCKIAFDKHYGTINIVYFDEHDTPLESGTDRTADFIFAFDQWFKYYTAKNKTATIKIEQLNGKGLVIAAIPVVQHKTKQNWFEFYMEKDGWRKETGYWKDGLKFAVLPENKVEVTRNVGRVDESKITINAPGDELQVKVMLDLVK